MIQHTSSKVGLIWTLIPCCVVVTRPGDFAEKDKAKKGEEKRNKQTLPEAKLITFLSPKRHPLGT